MQDVLTRLSTIRRPGLLVRAAQIGAENYRRALHLRRLTDGGVLPRSTSALIQLIEIEAEMNLQRKMADASYSLIRHLDVVIAMIGEARLLRARPEDPT